MALEEFEKDEISDRDRGFVRMRSMMDMGMGALWTLMGGFLIFKNHFALGVRVNLDDSTARIFGATCVLYGVFRIYRGIKQNYFKER